MDETPHSGDRPQVLRSYALVADGERGAVVGPAGEIVWLCFPGWDDDPLFASLLGGRGRYVVCPTGRFVWGGQYDEATLMWRHRWLVGGDVVECVDALAYPGRPDRAVLVRRVIAVRGGAEVSVHLQLGDDFGNRRATRLRSPAEGVWEGRHRDIGIRWQAPGDVHWRAGSAGLVTHLDAGDHLDLVLELAAGSLDDEPVDGNEVLSATEARWRQIAPQLPDSLAERDARHAIAVLRGMTTCSGAMMAAATTSLPERSDEGRDYDYRYAWIRDQCYTGIAAATAGDAGDLLVDDAVRFVHQRLLADGPDLRPAYRGDGSPVPTPRHVEVPGYPGAPTVMVGNQAGKQFQLDVFGEALSLFAAAAERDRMYGDAWRAAEVAADGIEARWRQPDAGVWETSPARYTQSRLSCVAGLRRLAACAPAGPTTTRWLALADAMTAAVAATAVHSSGRWQRADDDERCDAALLLGGLRGALAVDDPRTRATLAAVRRELVRDGYTFRYRVDDAPLGRAEGAFLLCGFWLALACDQAGDHVAAAHFFERNRAACGPAGIYTEEYDVHQRQQRGNFPQAFVHALLLQTAMTLGGTAER